LSAYQQHKSVLLEKGIIECPRINIMNELGKQLAQWLEEGHQILVAGDFNEDVRSTHITQFFGNYSMKELIIKKHGISAPNTFINGTNPIDGIFGTITLRPTIFGYSNFSWGMYSDHRVFWVDLDMSTVLGTKDTPLWKPQARRLKCENPSIVQRFNTSRLAHMETTKMEDKMEEKEALIRNKVPLEEWGRKVEALDALRVDGILLADKKCRKLKMGNVPWSPALKRLMVRIDYLQRF
jgi:hypothetical protein